MNNEYLIIYNKTNTYKICVFGDFSTFLKQNALKTIFQHIFKITIIYKKNMIFNINYEINNIFMIFIMFYENFMYI